MDTLEALSSQLETTTDIRSIVRTMKSLSSASIHSYERAVEAISTYERTINLGLRIVLRDDIGQMHHPDTVTGRAAMIVIGSDRGLCGRFNDRIAEFAAEKLRAAATEPPFLAVVGVRAAARLEAAGHPADRSFGLPGSIGGLTETVQTIAVGIDRWVAEDRVDGVALVYNRHRGGTLAEPVESTLLPVPKDHLNALARAPWPSRQLPTFRMERGQLLSWLISQYLFVGLYRGLAESLASEHASRLTAMQGAEHNIDDRLDDLRAAYRQKRQETITRELLDVVAGYESVRSKD